MVKGGGVCSAAAASKARTQRGHGGKCYSLPLPSTGTPLTVFRQQVRLRSTQLLTLLRWRQLAGGQEAPRAKPALGCMTCMTLCVGWVGAAWCC